MNIEGNRPDEEPMAPSPIASEEEDRRALNRFVQGGELRSLLPVALAGFLMYWAFRGVSWPKVIDAVRHLNIKMVAPGLLISLFGYVLGDSLGYAAGFRWVVPNLRWPEALRLRLAALLPQSSLSFLAGVLSVSYLYRRHRVHPLISISSIMFVSFSEALLVSASLSLGFALSPQPLNPAWLIYPVVVYFLLGFTLVTLKTPLRPRLERRFGQPRIFHAFRIAPIRRYGWAALLRSPISVGQLLGGYWALRGMGLDVYGPVLLLAIPLTNISALALSVGGFGGPQAVLLYFLAAYGPSEKILAFSLLWSATFTLGRAGVGLVFFPGIWKRLSAGAVIERGASENRPEILA